MREFLAELGVVKESTNDLTELKNYLYTLSSRSRSYSVGCIEAQRIALYGLLLPGLTHELNNYLTCVVGYSQFARRQGGQADHDAELQIIEDESLKAAKLNRLAQSLWTEAQSDASDYVPRQLLEKVENLSRAALRRSGLQLEMDYADVGDCRLPGNPGIVRDFLLSFLGCFASHVHHHGTLECQVQVESEALVLKVRLEICPDEPMIDRGQALGSSMAFPHIREWLGVCCRELSRRSGVHLADLQAEGSVLTHSFQITGSADSGGIDERSKNKAWPRVLIADAGDMITNDLRQLLEEEGIEVQVFNDPELAVHEASRSEFDLLFVGVRPEEEESSTAWLDFLSNRPTLQRRTIFTVRPDSVLNPTSVDNWERPLLRHPIQSADVRRVLREHLAVA